MIPDKSLPRLVLRCPLCGGLIWRLDNLAVWFALAVMLALTTEAVLVALLVRLAGAS